MNTATNKCKCGRFKYGNEQVCLGEFIGEELRKVRLELKRLDGWLPWYQRPEFKAELAKFGRAA